MSPSSQNKKYKIKKWYEKYRKENKAVILSKNNVSSYGWDLVWESVYLKVRKDGGVAEQLGLFAFILSFLLSSIVEYSE